MKKKAKPELQRRTASPHTSAGASNIATAGEVLEDLAGNDGDQNAIQNRTTSGRGRAGTGSSRSSRR